MFSIFIFYIGFPIQKGRHEFQNLPSWAEDQCEAIQFQPYLFYPHQKIHIQLTVNHVNYTDAAFVHEAVIPWVESVNSTQFTACVTRVGRNDYPADSFATVDWIAYQGAPPGGVAGEETFPRWWTGTSCQTVTLPNVGGRKEIKKKKKKKKPSKDKARSEEADVIGKIGLIIG